MESRNKYYTNSDLSNSLATIGGTYMNKVKTTKGILYIATILFLIAAARGGNIGNVAIACACFVLARLQKEKEK